METFSTLSKGKTWPLGTRTLQPTSIYLDHSHNSGHAKYLIQEAEEHNMRESPTSVTPHVSFSPYISLRFHFCFPLVLFSTSLVFILFPHISATFQAILSFFHHPNHTSGLPLQLISPHQSLDTHHCKRARAPPFHLLAPRNGVPLSSPIVSENVDK